MTMTREELIRSLPHWLRDRASQLLRHNAYCLGDMMMWEGTDEGYVFWNKCHYDASFDEAIAWLRDTRPEVYQKYYAKYFEEKLEEPNFDWYTEEHNSIGSCAIAVCLALSKLDVSLPNDIAYNIGAIVHRYEELESKLRTI